MKAILFTCLLMCQFDKQAVESLPMNVWSKPSFQVAGKFLDQSKDEIVEWKHDPVGYHVRVKRREKPNSMWTEWNEWVDKWGQGWLQKDSAADAGQYYTLWSDKNWPKFENKEEFVSYRNVKKGDAKVPENFGIQMSGTTQSAGTSGNAPEYPGLQAGSSQPCPDGRCPVPRAGIPSQDYMPLYVGLGFVGGSVSLILAAVLAVLIKRKG